MNITLTFTDPDGMNIPDGATLTFEDVDSFEVSTPADIEDIGCEQAGCDGCSSMHRRFTGTAHLTLDATGPRQSLRWAIPPAPPVTVKVGGDLSAEQEAALASHIAAAIRRHPLGGA